MPNIATATKDHVLTITFTRPEKRNAIDTATLHEFSASLTEAAKDDQVRCVVIEGEGKMFSSGIDLAVLADSEQSLSGVRAFRDLAIRTYNQLEELLKPTIAKLHGGCLGMALELALACDFRVATNDTLLGLPETRIGLVPDVGGSSRLPAIVGLGNAKELIMTGKILHGGAAKDIQLLNRSTTDISELETVTQELISELLLCAPLAVGRAKRLLDNVAKPTLSQTLEHEIAVQEMCLATEDFREGVAAVRAKRPPQFRGC